jgi:hypothetical protein
MDLQSWIAEGECLAFIAGKKFGALLSGASVRSRDLPRLRFRVFTDPFSQGLWRHAHAPVKPHDTRALVPGSHPVHLPNRNTNRGRSVFQCHHYRFWPGISGTFWQRYRRETAYFGRFLHAFSLRSKFPILRQSFFGYHGVRCRRFVGISTAPGVGTETVLCKRRRRYL